MPVASPLHQKQCYRPTNQEIFFLLGKGKTTKMIANEINLSFSTVETHRKNIRKKLNLIGYNELAILSNDIVSHNS